MARPMSPGAYLAKRRQAAGYSLQAAAAALACHPALDDLRQRKIVGPDLKRLHARLALAEADRDNLTISQVVLLQHLFPLDIDVYERLLLIFHGVTAFGTPRVCRDCACSWSDACPGGCAWSEDDPEICTACECAAVLAPGAPADWPGSPLPEGALPNG